jgi:hypothetical protein
VKLSESKDPSSPRPLRVLIVEDSENDTLLLLRELERGGYEPNYERVETAEAMERLGGTLGVQTAQGSGTTIHARIPAQRMGPHV